MTNKTKNLRLNEIQPNPSELYENCIDSVEKLAITQKNDIQTVYAKNKASDKQCRNCKYYVENYIDNYTLRYFGYGKVKCRPACSFANTYGFVSHNPARLCIYYEAKEV